VQDSDLKKSLVSLVMGVLLALGLLVYFFGDRSYFRFGRSEEKAPPPPCEKDPACAVKKADALGDMSQGELRLLAGALSAALGRKDCALAAELTDGVERIALREPALAERRRAAVAAQRAACGERQTDVPPPPVGSKVVLERTRCYGKCPAYSLTVHPDGRVEFDGKSDVAVSGHQSYGIERKKARDVFDLLERVHFEKLDEEYLSSATDHPLAKITLVRGDIDHSVVADGPCSTSSAINAGLCYLTQRIDELAESERFVSSADR
jgi:Domain of unknown function (DUF6438)